MTWLFESPVTILWIGIVVEAILIGGFLKTGRKSLALAAGAALAVILALLIIERLVETDNEAVRRTVHELARAVEANHLPAVLSHLSERSPEVRAQASAEMPRYSFSRVEVKTNLTTAIRRDVQPPAAEARFNVIVDVSDKGGFLNNQRVPRFVVLELAKEDDGQWRVVAYSHHEPQRGWQREEP